MELRKKNIEISIDWLSFTMKHPDPTTVIQLLGLSDMPWAHAKGRNGYRNSLRFLDVVICYDGQPGMGVWCELSGKGCRAFETLSQVGWDSLLQRLLRSDIHITRLDVAGDDRVGILSMRRLVLDAQHGNYISRLRGCRIYQDREKGHLTGTTVYFGKGTSRVQIRIYDKAAEQHLPGNTHWVRCELQLRDDRAFRFLAIATESNIGETYSGVLANYLRFVTPSKSDTNKSRQSVCPYWRRFLGEAERVSVYFPPGLDYTEAQCINYVVNQAGNAIAALIDIYGVDQLVSMLGRRTIRPNPKYAQLVEKHRLIEKEE